VRRIFLLGPSHHAYLEGVSLSQCQSYDTPFGRVPVDTDVVNSLVECGSSAVTHMSIDVDEDDHSLELQLPYIAKLMRDHGGNYSVVPMLVGNLDTADEKALGEVLKPYIVQPGNLFVVSSDFCHWGARFRHMYIEEGHREIWQSIEAVDRRGMHLIEQKDIAAFKTYLNKTNNTICGRNPIILCLSAIHAAGGDGFDVKFTHYSQSSQVKSRRDSSVSYASALITARQ